ncbi:MAG: hypothetical protein WCB51_08710 [Candidatus Dormiibacterota bacterium]
MGKNGYITAAWLTVVSSATMVFTRTVAAAAPSPCTAALDDM